MVAWFDYQFHRHHGLHRHHDHHHHKNNVHNVHGQLDHQTISIDWNQVFSAMPLRRNKKKQPINDWTPLSLVPLPLSLYLLQRNKQTI